MPRSARPPRWPVDGEPARGRARPRSSPPVSRWSAAEELQVERSGASAHLAVFLLTRRSRTQDSRRRVWPTGGPRVQTPRVTTRHANVTRLLTCDAAADED